MPGEVDRHAARIARWRADQQSAARHEAEQRERIAKRLREERAAQRSPTVADHPVKPGQIWASNKPADRDAGIRQYRKVQRVYPRGGRVYVELVTIEDDGMRPAREAQCTSRSVKGHRLVNTPESTNNDAAPRQKQNGQGRA